MSAHPIHPRSGRVPPFPFAFESERRWINCRSTIEAGRKFVASQHALTDLPRRGFRIAEALGITPWYVEEIIRSKQLPAIKLGRHYTILREDMDAFLDRKRGEWRK
jgi:excisionase family DNA binding protein